MQDRGRIANALTIDVEDYFQVSALAPFIERSAWETTPCRVERNVDRLLELLNERGSKATFFTLGWLAQRYPRVVRDIVSQGHELASHGHAHLRATEQSRAEFDRTSAMRRSCSKIRRESQCAAIARQVFPSAIEICGRSTVSPQPAIATARAFIQCAMIITACRMRRAFRLRARHGLLEIPVTTTRVFGRNLPAGGGGYFRLAPYALSRWAIHRVNRVDRRPAIFYFHPWEIDPQQPRVTGVGLKTRFRHYVNLNRTELEIATVAERLPLGPGRSRFRSRRSVRSRMTPLARRPLDGPAVREARPSALGVVRRRLS